MSRPAPPVLTVRYDGSERTFAAGNDVIIGRDLRADVRVAHPLISRAHLLVRFDQGRWLAIDNGSLNGLYVNNRRVPVVDIQDGQRVNIGNPDGPALTFEVGRHQGSAGRPPLTASIPIGNLVTGAQPPQSPPQTGASWPSPPPPQASAAGDLAAAAAGRAQWSAAVASAQRPATQPSVGVATAVPDRRATGPSTHRTAAARRRSIVRPRQYPRSPPRPHRPARPAASAATPTSPHR